MKPMRISTRVVLSVLFPALLVATLLALYFSWARNVDLEKSIKDRGFAIVQQLASSAEYGVFSGNREMLAHLVGTLVSNADIAAVIIRDAEGNILARHGDAITAAIHKDIAIGPVQSVEDDDRILLSSAPIIRSRIPLGELFATDIDDINTVGRERQVLGRVYVAISRSIFIERQTQLLRDSILLTLAVLVISILLALRMSSGVTRPITTLSNAVRKLAAGDLTTRVVPDPSGAVRTLEDGINAMATALQTSQDNLERRITEATAQLAERKEEAESANDAKTRFLAAASHDLRQPLHALGLFIAALRDRSLPGETHHLVEQIERSVAAMEDLLDALLDISRLDAGAITPTFHSFPVNRIFENIRNVCAPEADAKGLKFQVAPCSPYVYSDPALLERILLNLTLNAIRYTHRGKVLLGCRRHGDTLRIEVWDTGVGIPSDQLQLVFREFYRIKKPRSEAGMGLGLGLAIVERYARLLSHPLHLRSEIGKGSVFAITVPLGVPAQKVVEPKGASLVAGQLAGKCVLVVDDDPLSQKAMQTLLKDWGCEVLTAVSGTDAIARLEMPGDWHPHAIICDYRLADGETGTQVIERLRIALSANIPSIMISGDTSADVLRASHELGCPLLHKPVRPAVMRTLLERLCGRLPTGPA